MSLTSISIDEAIERLCSLEGPVMSVYLPYGSSDQQERSLIQNRVKTLQDAKRKLSACPDSHWCETLEEIFADNIATEIDRQRNHLTDQVTSAFFSTPKESLKVTIQAQLRPHFAFAPYAEIEPLVYCKWAESPYWVLKLDMSGPSLMHGEGFSLEPFKARLPRSIMGTFGDSLSHLTFRKVMEMSDFDFYRNQRKKYQCPDFENEVADQLQRRKRQISYWLRLLAEVCRYNTDNTKGDLYVFGEHNLTQRFVSTGAKVVPCNVVTISNSETIGTRSMAQAVMKEITRTKLITSSIELSQLKYSESLREIRDLVNHGQTRVLYVRQDDWFADPLKGSSNFEQKNPRSYLISLALKKKIPVKYTSQEIHNKQGLAAVGF